jgi:Protein of unknown function (DUF3485)
MRTVSTLVAVSLVVGLTLGGGYVDGLRANRWGVQVDFGPAAKSLRELPPQIGDWRLSSSQELDADVRRILQCAGHVNCTYANSKGDAVNVAIVLGPSGPISVHTPEICYSSRDFDIAQEAATVQVRPEQSPDEAFWALTMKSKSPGGGLLRVYYAWSLGQEWQAPYQPRFAYGGQPLLYKIQLASLVASESLQSGRDPCLEFLKDLLPVLDKVLHRPPGA